MAAEKSIRVQVQKDYLEKLSSGQPAQCLAEIIWNAVDAEASDVQVKFHKNELITEQIEIIDNGHGIAFHDAEALFSSLGGSWKSSTQHSSNEKRFLHGQEGKGRFKAFALGRHVSWNIAYEMDGAVWEYEVRGTAEDMEFFYISEPQPSAPGRIPGVTVTISDLFRSYPFFEAEVATEAFSPIFAQYLQWYPQVKISFDGQTITPEKVIRSRTEYPMPSAEMHGQKFPVFLEIVEWTANVEKGLYFSNETGFPLDKYNRSIRTPGDFVFTAYLKSGMVTHMFNSGILSLHQMDEHFNEALETAIEQIQKHFLGRQKEEAKNFLSLLRDRSVYPFDSAPKTAKAKKERAVFDTIAIALLDLTPDFRNAPAKSQALQLRLLRQALETNPEQLQTDIMESLAPSGDILKELQKAFGKL